MTSRTTTSTAKFPEIEECVLEMLFISQADQNTTKDIPALFYGIFKVDHYPTDE